MGLTGQANDVNNQGENEVQRALSLADNLDIDVINDNTDGHKYHGKNDKAAHTGKASVSALRLSPRANKPRDDPYSPFKGMDSVRSQSVAVASPKAAFVKFEAKGDTKSPKKFIN